MSNDAKMLLTYVALWILLHPFISIFIIEPLAEPLIVSGVPSWSFLIVDLIIIALLQWLVWKGEHLSSASPSATLIRNEARYTRRAFTAAGLALLVLMVISMGYAAMAYTALLFYAFLAWVVGGIVVFMRTKRTAKS